jgi:hypothetical protein
MIYRGPGFLWFGLLDHSLTPSPVSKLFLFLSLPVCRRSSLLTEEGIEGAGKELNHTTARKPGPFALFLSAILTPQGCLFCPRTVYIWLFFYLHTLSSQQELGPSSVSKKFNSKQKNWGKRVYNKGEKSVASLPLIHWQFRNTYCMYVVPKGQNVLLSPTYTIHVYKQRWVWAKPHAVWSQRVLNDL